MADQDIFHTAEIIKAAIPYVDPKTKSLAELFAKLLDLMGSLKTVKSSGNVTAYGFQGIKIDVEGLLKGIRPICSGKELEFVDRILNIFNMKKVFEMYNNMMSTMKTMQEFGGFSFGDSGSDNVAENIAGNFSGMNFESIFQNVGNLFNSESQGKGSNTDSPEMNYNVFEKFNSSPHEEATAEDPIKDNGSNADSNQTTNNNKMFDMLKAMVPPEQMSTFENLSMLFNTMSYDNNSKPDDSKEHNDD